MRGYFGIGIENVKFPKNIGTLWRSADALGASFVFVVGERYKKQKSDTNHTSYNIPLYTYNTWGHFRESIPENCKVIGIEYPAPKIEGKQSWQLQRFVHPEQAIYLLGAEDNGISTDGLILCNSFIHIPSKFCMNVAAIGSIVMWDRVSKEANSGIANSNIGSTKVVGRTNN